MVPVFLAAGGEEALQTHAYAHLKKVRGHRLGVISTGSKNWRWGPAVITILARAGN